MRTLFIFCVAAVFLTLTANAGEYSFPTPDNFAESSVVSITLSGEQYQKLGGHSEWLRLYDAKGNIIPWALEQVTEKSSRVQRVRTPLTITEVRKPSDGTLEISFQTDANAMLPDAAVLVFRTNVKDFEQQVQIYGYEADGTEKPLEMDGFIFDSTSLIAARNLEVKFSPGQCRSFKVVLSSASLERKMALRSLSVTKKDGEAKRTDEQLSFLEQPFNAGNIELWSEQVVETGRVPKWTPVSIPFEVTHPSESQTTLQTVPNVFPINAIEPVFAEENYSRKVIVQNLFENRSFEVGGARLRQLKVSGIFESITSMPIRPPVTKGVLEIVIEDGDNPPLTPKNLLVYIPVYRLQFIAEPSQFPLKLTAIPNAEKPAYDVDSILTLGGDTMTVLELHPDDFTGEIIIADAAKASSGKFSRVWLFLALGLAVAAMAAALISTVKKAE